jgi:hypothetical protein
MTTDAELRALADSVELNGGLVAIYTDNQYRIQTVRIIGCPPISEHRMPPIKAAEAMRTWLHEHARAK